MAKVSARFGVGDPEGARSSEWVVMWKSTKSDVYLAARTLGGTLKVSLHENGQCHVRAPDPSKWRSPGSPPRFLDRWTINPRSQYEFPFGIIVPTSELTRAVWAKHRDKGTVWLPAKPGAAVEIAVFLTRAEPRPMNSLSSAGWNKIIVLERLCDGRDLWVVAGETKLPEDRRMELERIKRQVRPLIATLPAAPANPRLLLFATNEQGTRRFVEAAVH
ncbi:MAG: hypothetical protein ACFFCW_46510 [Candidatus Hodarchaeota archaeon]